MRYTDSQKKKILAKIDSAPRGKAMDVIKKLGVAYGTIHKWRKGAPIQDARQPASQRVKGVSKSAIAELFKIRNDFNRVLKKL